MGSCYGRPPRQPTVKLPSRPLQASLDPTEEQARAQVVPDASRLQPTVQAETFSTSQRARSRKADSAPTTQIPAFRKGPASLSPDRAEAPNIHPRHGLADSPWIPPPGGADGPGWSIEALSDDTPALSNMPAAPEIVDLSPLNNLDSGAPAASSSQAAMRSAFRSDHLRDDSGTAAAAAASTGDGDLDVDLAAVHSMQPPPAADSDQSNAGVLSADSDVDAQGEVEMTSAQLLQDEAFARQAQFLADHGFGSSEGFLVAALDDDGFSDDESEADIMSYEELLRLGEAAGCVGRGLPASFAAALPRRSYQAAREMSRDRNAAVMKHCDGAGGMHAHSRAGSTSRGWGRRCVVCQEDFVDGEEVAALPCRHSFHAPCIAQWLAAQKMCPCCNREAASAAAQLC